MKDRYGRCTVCKEYPDAIEIMTGTGHKCKTRWLCRLEDEEPGDEREIYAADAGTAAEKFMERTNDDDGSFTHYAVVLVFNATTGYGVSVPVDGEVVRTYSAIERKINLVGKHPDFLDSDSGSDLGSDLKSEPEPELLSGEEGKNGNP